MDELTTWIILAVGGMVAGVVNTLAGGGSLLTVPLLVLLGLPGGVANGTNRVGILLQCLAAAWRFRKEGVFEPRSVLQATAPVVLGSLVGAFWVSRVADATFERVFGVLMLLLLVPTLRQVSGGTRPANPGRRNQSARGCQTMYLRLAIKIAPGRASLGAGTAGYRVDVHTMHCRQVD